MNNLVHLDHNQNFWELNPQFKNKTPYKLLYSEDKNKKKHESSTIMWFVVYCYYPQSIYCKLETDEKHSIVGEDICGSIDYYTEHKETIDMLVDNFCNDVLTPFQRHMHELEVLLSKRSKFINQQDYTFENSKELDAMVKATTEIYKNYKSIIDDLNKEDSGEGAKGGAMPSLID